MLHAWSGYGLVRGSLKPTPSGISAALLAMFFAVAATPALLGQAAATPAQEQQKMSTPADTPDAQIVETPQKRRTPAELRDDAWAMLTTAVTDDKHPQTRIQALAALGFLGASPRSLKLIHNATLDKDVDVRTASILAAGQTKSPLVENDLRQMLDDREPQVAFTAAITLWKMHDRSGEDVLLAVASGGRRASAGMVSGTEHTIHKELEDPAGLAKYGAMQGAYMLLGPFGMGLTAFEYLHKNGGDQARVSAIEAIGQNHTDLIRKELMKDLLDKDLGVRAASAKALARYHQPEVGVEIAKLFPDVKPPVHYTAAAAYLISTGAAPGSPDPDDATQATRRSK